MTKNPTAINIDTLIIGAGFSGLYLANVLLDLGYKNFIIAAPDQATVSDKSYYDFRSRGVRQDSMKSSILKAGKRKSNCQLVNVLVNGIDDELTYLNSFAKLKPSFIGAQVINPQGLLLYLKNKTGDYQTRDEVISIEKQSGHFIAKTTKQTIISQKIVFCSGGNRAEFSKIFSEEKIQNNVFTIAQRLGCAVIMLDKIMYHPFYSEKGVCLPSDSLADFRVVNEKGQELKKTNELLRAHNAHHCFDEILAELKKNRSCFAVKGKTKIKLIPQPHYRLGGLKIDKAGRTNQKNIYALGECACGMHGLGRIGGCALSEIIVMARVIAQQ
ncbi:MAG: FAD-binding protein, partial [Patescibacteria group bacterium]